MEDSFKVRVDRIFGSLSSNNLWSLTDHEIPTRTEPEPEPDLHSNPFFAFDDDDDDDDDENPKSSADNNNNNNNNKPDEYGDEEWEIKSSIGLDSTLDYEEEEDEFDKVAVGNVKNGDRLYMKDVTECEYGIIPTSIGNFNKEDSNKNHYLQNPKSILKRKVNQVVDDAKSQKRVRFDPQCKMEEKEVEEVKVPPSEAQVPDYLRNPSRYTHYTFDSSNDMDEQSNTKAYLDFLNMLNKSTTPPTPLPPPPPKSITFIPKKKLGDRMVGNSEQRGILRGIAAEVEDEDVSSMEEDEEKQQPPILDSGRNKLGRHYRIRTCTNMLESEEA